MKQHLTKPILKKNSATIVASNLDVADDAAGSVIEKLHAHLDAPSLGTGAAKNLGHLRMNDEHKEEWKSIVTYRKGSKSFN